MIMDTVEGAPMQKNVSLSAAAAANPFHLQLAISAITVAQLSPIAFVFL